jgi:hypothetical protein
MKDAKALVIYWYGKQYDAVRMHQKLLTLIREDCPSYSTEPSGIRKQKCGEDIDHWPSGSGGLPGDHLLVRIAAALEESLFHSVRSLDLAVKYPPTVWWHLYSSGHVLRHLHTLPHAPSPDQIGARVAFAIKLKMF